MLFVFMQIVSKVGASVALRGESTKHKQKPGKLPPFFNAAIVHRSFFL